MNPHFDAPASYPIPCKTHQNRANGFDVSIFGVLHYFLHDPYTSQNYILRCNHHRVLTNCSIVRYNFLGGNFLHFPAISLKTGHLLLCSGRHIDIHVSEKFRHFSKLLFKTQGQQNSQFHGFGQSFIAQNSWGNDGLK